MSKLFSNFFDLHDKFGCWIGLCAFYCILLIKPTISQAKILTVDSISHHQLTVSNNQKNFTSIQKAIDAASTGDTINIKPGIYKESITFKKNLTLAGSGSKVTRLEFDRESLVLSTSDVKRANIQGLTIAYTGKGQRSTLWFFRSNIRLENCIVTGGFYSGIYITAGSNVTIRNCQITKNQRIGINIANSTVRLVESKISQNAHYGLKITKCQNTIVENCEIRQNQWSGIYISDGKLAEDIPKSTVTLRKNIIQTNQQDGITVRLADQVIISQNWIQENMGNGIKLKATASQLFRNVITNNQRDGLVVRQSSKVLVDHNTFASQQVGLNLQNTDKLKVENNIIAYHQTGVVTTLITNAAFAGNNLWTNQKHYSNLKIPVRDTLYDPKFMSVAKKNYSLKNDSPMIGNATDKTDIGGLPHSNPPKNIDQSKMAIIRPQPKVLPPPQTLKNPPEMAKKTMMPEDEVQPVELAPKILKMPNAIVNITHLQQRPYLVEVGQTVQLAVQTVFPKLDFKTVDCRLVNSSSENPTGFIYQKQQLKWRVNVDQIGLQVVQFQADQVVIDIRFFVWQQRQPPRITKINGNLINRAEGERPIKYEVPSNKESKLVFEAEGGEMLKFSYVFLPVGAKTKDNTLTWKPPRNLLSKLDSNKPVRMEKKSSPPKKESVEYPLLVVAENGAEVDVLDLILVVQLD